ncbi:hypothetical protein [Pelagibius sp. Alg239-R121]|uniref:hypothetical protein n=1 Tax=Pelagibius sp. Alg239-R121 TaxID=2993448 RepID=UPI0024A6CDD1|nr:hypothetical protein [Pelagibius sp. Alg239-R121]
MSVRHPLFASPPAEIAPYLERLRSVDALGMPLLTETGRLSLLKAAEALPYRQAKPYMGAPGKEVQQDFEICMEFDGNDSFSLLADNLADQLRAAASLLPDPPLTDALTFNDIAVQRYLPGSAGITPHRDFLQFRQVVILIILAGQGRFFACDNREGLNAAEVPVKPGDALLMQAPDFGGQNRQPFHFLRDITERRVIVGLRYDVKKAPAQSNAEAS